MGHMTKTTVIRNDRRTSGRTFANLEAAAAIIVRDLVIIV